MSQSPKEPYGANPVSTAPTDAEKRRNRRTVLFILVAVFVLGTGGLLYYRSKMPKAPAYPGGVGAAAGGRRGAGGFGMAGPLPVVVNLAKKADINVVLNGLGTVTPLATVTVRTQISG